MQPGPPLHNTSLHFLDWGSVSVVLKICLSEPAGSRFDPGNWLPWAVRILFETYIEIAIKCLLMQGDILSAHCVTSPQVTSLATHYCRCVMFERDMEIVWQRWMSADKLDYLYMWGATHFNQLDLIRRSSDSSLSCNFCNIVHLCNWDFRGSHGSCVLCVCVLLCLWARARITNLLQWINVCRVMFLFHIKIIVIKPRIMKINLSTIVRPLL
jgi:hypothetical protein